MVERVLIAHGKAVSLGVVANTLASFFKKNGYVAFTTKAFTPKMALTSQARALFYVMPADPVYATEYVAYYLMLKSKYRDKLIWYSTVEGRLKAIIAKKPVWFHVDFTANSKYTMEKLLEMGYTVRDVIPHGYDPDEVTRAREKAKQLRARIDRDHPDTVRFGIVSSTHPRKNLDGLITAIAFLPEEIREKCRFMFISEPSLKMKLPTKECLYVADMGSLTHVDVLAFMGAVDYLIHPSQAEGFGLPVLESMAMGTPVLHCWYPPLSEFSTREGNLTWDFESVNLLEGKGGMVFELHTFNPQSLTDAVKKAYEIKTTDEETYKKMKETVENHAKNYTIDKVYQKFLEWVG